MKIDENRINDLLISHQKATGSLVDEILNKALNLKRLSLDETSVLLNADAPELVEKIFTAAASVKDKIYGRRVVLFVPLYIANYCMNGCLYCGFKNNNSLLKRKVLNSDEIKKEVAYLLERGHKRILMVSSEFKTSPDFNIVDYYVDAIKAIYSVQRSTHRIKRVNINCAPLPVEGFRKIKLAGIGTYQLFQETYHNQTYKKIHPYGPKSDYDNRLDAIDRAFAAGIDDVGIGVLYGLYDWKFETLAMLSHVEYLENKFGVGPHTISVPRLESASGVDDNLFSQYRVSDLNFKRIVAILRLSVPYTGMILSTRESPLMRDELVGLGISQISAESNTSPGGYCESGNLADDSQFSVCDHRCLDEIIKSLIEHNYIPSFCAACYRKQRTGEAFMNLARPGTIKGCCDFNALVTLKEYLDDFATASTRDAGYSMINREKTKLSAELKTKLLEFFKDIDNGERDKYV